MSNTIQKEAQALTKLKEWVRPSGKRKTRLSPVRWTGKKLLKMRSPDVYGKALEIVEKADKIIRKSASEQKIYLAQMKKHMKGLSVNGFAVSASRFISEQKVINTAVNKIDNVFSKIADEHGVKGGTNSAARINYAINIDLGKKPDISKFDFGKDIDRLGYEEERTRDLFASIELFDQICKEAFLGNLGGRYWKSKTRSGKKFQEGFKKVYAEFELISKRNISMLEKLDELLSIGDPAEYLVQAQSEYGFANINKVLARTDIAEAWEMFKTAISAHQEKEMEQERVKQETAPKMQDPGKPISWMPGYGPEATTEVKTEIEKKPTTIPPPPPQPKLQPIEEVVKTLPPPPINKTKIIEEPEKKEIEKKQHNEFINALQKKAENNETQDEIAQFMLKYANEIDEKDPEYAEELTSIVGEMYKDE